MNDELNCPLCHKSNQCAVALGEDSKNCWCMSATISREVLESKSQQVNTSSRCFCQSCLEANKSIEKKDNFYHA